MAPTGPWRQDVPGHLAAGAAVGDPHPDGHQEERERIEALEARIRGRLIVVCRNLPTDPWTYGATNVPADWTAIRSRGEVVLFQSPDAAKPNVGTGASDEQRWDSWVAFPAASFDPSTVAGLAYYWNANSLTGAADGSAVSSLPATVGGVALGQGTAARQPTVQTTTGGNRVIRFTPDGTATNDDELVATIATASQPVTVAIVHSIGGTGVQQVLDAGVQVLTSTTQVQAYAGSTLSKTLALPDALGVTVAVYNGASSLLYRNGGTPSAGTTGTTAVAATFRVGRSGSAGRPLTGDVAAITVHTGALTSAQVQTLGAGLASMYPTASTWAAVTG